MGLGLVALALAEAGECRAQPAPGAFVGRVLDATGQPLLGATVRLIDPGGESRVFVTEARGEFAFEEIGPGECRLRVELAGYEPIDETFTMSPDAGRRYDVTLQIASIRETVVIRDRPVGTAGAEPTEPVELTPEQFDSLPLPTDRFQEALPLVPGVVRDPEGRLSFNGSRPSQSQLLVNGANVTDPVTGEFAVELPLKAIEAVEINSLPYSAEYGRVSGAVAKVKTRGGTDEFDIDYGDLFPRPNFRGGSLRGLRSFFPQIQISGPIKKGSAWFSQGIAYRYRRSRIFDAAEGDDERVLESFDTLTQLDFRIRDRHEVTTTFSFFPVEVDNLGLSAVVASDAAPDFESTGWNAAVSERSFFSRAVVETIVAVKRFDVRVRPNGSGVTSLTPEGLRGDYFNRLERDSLRLELGSAVTYSPKTLMGAHVLKFGGNVARTRFTGVDETAPIDLLDVDGRRIRRIEYVGDPAVEGFDVQASAFVQDQWRMNDRIGLDIGLRYDYDRLVGSQRLAPRAAAAVAVDEGGRTVIKTGFGIFYDHVFLQADRFHDYQTRVETPYDEDGNPGAPIVLRPRRSSEGLSMPRGAHVERRARPARRRLPPAARELP